MKKKAGLDSEEHKAPLLDKEGWLRPGGDGVVEFPGPPIHSLPHLQTFRTELRNNLTPAEAFLWSQLQNSKFVGKKFRRQHSIGNYIVDFYCASEQLAIELDGEGHYTEAAELYDKERDLFINQFNIMVLRFENRQVFDNLDWVLGEITKCFKE